MSTVRKLLVGILALAGIYVIASAIAAVIPFLAIGFILWMSVVGLHHYLVKKDREAERLPGPPK